MRSLPSPHHSRRHRALFAALYFSEGAPIGFLWWALPTLLTDAGADIQDVTALSSLLVVPWMFKFLWAPLVDALQTPLWTLRHWIIAAQLVMAASLVPLWGIEWSERIDLLRAVLLVHAFAAATQDVAIDAWCISITHEVERGRINGWMQAGMLLGRSLLGGGGLILAARYGVSVVLALLTASILLPALLVAVVREDPEPGPKQDSTGSESMEDRSRVKRFLSTLHQAASVRSTWLGVGFALTAGAAFESLGGVQGPLLQSLGWTSEQIGWLMAVPLVACMIAGSLVGGRLADRFHHSRTALASLILIMLHVSAVGLAAMQAIPFNSDGATSLLLCSEAFWVGSFTASSYALLMDLSEPQIAATQFSTFMAATNGCEAWAVRTGGLLIAASGFGPALLVMVLLSVPGLVFLVRLSRWKE